MQQTGSFQTGFHQNRTVFFTASSVLLLFAGRVVLYYFLESGLGASPPCSVLSTEVRPLSFCYRSVYFVESEYKNQIQDPTKEGTVRDVELYSNLKTIAESIPERRSCCIMILDGPAKRGFGKTMPEAGLL